MFQDAMFSGGGNRENITSAGRWLARSCLRGLACASHCSTECVCRGSLVLLLGACLPNIAAPAARPSFHNTRPSFHNNRRAFFFVCLLQPNAHTTPRYTTLHYTMPPCTVPNFTFYPLPKAHHPQHLLCPRIAHHRITLCPRYIPVPTATPSTNTDSFFGRPELNNSGVQLRVPTKCSSGCLALRVPDPPSYAPPTICAISKDGRVAAVGGKDLELCLWDTDSGESLAKLKGHEICWTSSNDCTFFVTVQVTKLVYIYISSSSKGVQE